MNHFSDIEPAGWRTYARLTAVALLAAGLIMTVTAGTAGAASSGGVGTTVPTTNQGSGSGDEGRSASNQRVSAKFERIWDGFSGKDKRWARTTSECESGGDPDAIGGGGVYRGAFQFMRSTWKASPKSPGGDPIAYPYRTQAVVAVLLMHRDGAGHWPVCG
jgi:hypothetical protein